MTNQKLLTFVQAISRLLHGDPPEPQILSQGAELLERLLVQDDWLPAQFAQPHPEFYRQYLLYADPLERFSVVSFVWGPGQKTPVHDHLTWGLIGMLRGQEIDTQYFKQADGTYQRGVSLTLVPGEVLSVSPSTHDVHSVANFYTDQTSISIHVYGGNIGRISRHAFEADTGAQKTFISGYNNDVVPNLWL